VFYSTTDKLKTGTGAIYPILQGKTGPILQLSQGLIKTLESHYL